MAIKLSDIGRSGGLPALSSTLVDLEERRAKRAIDAESLAMARERHGLDTRKAEVEVSELEAKHEHMEQLIDVRSEGLYVALDDESKKFTDSWLSKHGFESGIMSRRTRNMLFADMQQDTEFMGVVTQNMFSSLQQRRIKLHEDIMKAKTAGDDEKVQKLTSELKSTEPAWQGILKAMSAKPDEKAKTGEGKGFIIGANPVEHPETGATVYPIFDKDTGEVTGYTATAVGSPSPVKATTQREVAEHWMEQIRDWAKLNSTDPKVAEGFQILLSGGAMKPDEAKSVLDSIPDGPNKDRLEYLIYMYDKATGYTEYKAKQDEKKAKTKESIRKRSTELLKGKK